MDTPPASRPGPASAPAEGGRAWAARMIAPLSDAGEGTQASFVAQDFDLVGQHGQFLLHVSAQGLYRVFLNAARVGQDLLTPGWTCYDDRIAYQSYDVSALLRPGSNRIEIWLGDGWFRSQMLWAMKPIVNTWGERIAAIAEIEGPAGLVLKTDGNWASGLAPITRSGIYYGEDHDARLHGGAADRGVEPLAFDTARLVPAEATPVREMPPLAPVASWHDAEGRQVHDFGQNVAGYVRVRMRGPAGAIVRVEHSEVLGPGRAFDNRNYRSARAEAVYTLGGGDDEVCAPVFTFMGFRYARITVSGGAEVAEALSVPISSVPAQAGGFTCGVEAVNQLVRNTVWSQRANFIEVPTDCPQRDERLGWTGDAQVFAGTACWLADSEAFLRKYLRDVMHDQRADGAVAHFSPDPTRLHPIDGRGDWAGATGWGDVIVIMPWQLYLHYGDACILAETFPAMLKWLDYLWSISDGPIIHPTPEWGRKGFTFGDWLQPVGDNRKPRPTIGDDCAATLYHFISNRIAADVARILGRTAEARLCETRRDSIRAAFVREYFTASGRLAHNDQTSYALAFLHGLVPPEHFVAAKGYFRRVVEDAGFLIGTGFIGTPALLPALTGLGMHDLAQKVFLNRRVPGWLYQVEHGATTIWERWDALGENGEIYDPDMNSYNHYAYGAVCQWLFEQVAGVAPMADAPGFDAVCVAPSILPDLGHVEMWHDCRHGRIEAGWALRDGSADYTITLPAGCRGILAPALGGGIVGAGTHRFEIALS